MHRRDNKMRRRDNRMRRRDNRMHRRDNRRRRRDNRQRHRDSGPLGRSKRGTSSSGPAAGAGARAAPGGAGGYGNTLTCGPRAEEAVRRHEAGAYHGYQGGSGAIRRSTSGGLRPTGPWPSGRRW
ncbi:PREDICTED: uncharacterized protein LOC109470380 [Branchiostoma belcheri]|uniref:Uncharacterized protein LOC109470380 n=1 Tax=Branchiostoma belcheri TaxID=7741 RepID=A0A6P4YT10_BRABE|nr:PREDICTED: uncharacterized protein LOC109470380 [Branchiostoma belcheri]